MALNASHVLHFYPDRTMVFSENIRKIYLVTEYLLSVPTKENSLGTAGRQSLTKI